MKSLVLGLSLIPGLPHLLLGKRNKGAALLCVAAAVLLTAAMTGSYLLRCLMGLMYLATMVPAALDVYVELYGGRRLVDPDAPAYVVFLLLVTGMGALPLLWQSPRFSKRAKIAWSAAVVVLAAGFFSLLALFGRDLEKFLRGRI